MWNLPPRQGVHPRVVFGPLHRLERFQQDEKAVAVSWHAAFREEEVRVVGRIFIHRQHPQQTQCRHDDDGEDEAFSHGILSSITTSPTIDFKDRQD